MRTARIGHDLRGPLQSLVAATALLRRTSIDAGQRQHVDSIEAATGQLIRLIDELIADADAPRTRPEPFAPRKLVEDLVDVIAPRARAAGLHIESVVAADVPTVVIADRPRLERILSNLLHNAVKYTPRGSITLRVARVAADRYRFDVEDTGLGIPPGRLGAIFDPFVQLDPANTAGGLGLGLAICRELVERLEGTISVRSTVGEGTVFSVELTLEEATDPDVRHERPAFDVGRMGFLLVGVGAETAAGLKGLLAPWGPTIRERSDAVSDEDIAASDVAIVDCEHTPATLDLAGVPARIVLCTPERPPPPGRATERDNVAIVMKPVHEADLHRALARILRRSHRARTSTAATVIPDLAGLQLLVADDDPVNADYLRLCLESAGATVTTTTSPRLIIGLAQERDWSAILVDLEMPEAHGVDVITRLRAIEDAGRRTPIIVVSGYDGEPIDRAYRAGASAHLTKPVTPREIVAVVATFARRVDGGPLPAWPRSRSR
jgi:CheY-like chemotaxis protein